jgi:hypothetical protein
MRRIVGPVTPTENPVYFDEMYRPNRFMEREIVGCRHRYSDRSYMWLRRDACPVASPRKNRRLVLINHMGSNRHPASSQNPLVDRRSA